MNVGRVLSVTKSFSFEAAHHLPNYDGDCHRLHGHSYKLQVTVSGEVKDNNMVIDFKRLKRIVEEKVVKKYDHTYLNDFFDYPTAELMCLSFFETLDRAFKEEDVVLDSVKLWETEDSFAECRR